MRIRAIAMLAGCAAVALACGSSVELTDSGASGEAGAASVGDVGGASAGGASSGGNGAGPNLFACGVSYDCTQDIGHLGPVPEDDLRCGGELVASGGPGAVLVTSQPGPYPTEIENLVVLLPNGKAFTQTRSRCTVEGACNGQNTTEWSLSPLEMCDVEVDPESIAGCGDPNGTCEWFAHGVDCTPVAETWTCAELPSSSD